MVRIYFSSEAYTTRVELLSLQASMVRSSINRRTVRVLQLNSSAASGIDKSSFFIGTFFRSFRRYLFVGISVIQAFVLIDIVNPEPISICKSEVDGFEGVAIDNFFQFREMKI
jgi:hypothetical protein